MTERSGSTCECDPERPRPYETAINCPPIARQEFDTHASYTSTGVRLLSRQLSGQTARSLGLSREIVRGQLAWTSAYRWVEGDGRKSLNRSGLRGRRSPFVQISDPARIRLCLSRQRVVAVTCPLEASLDSCELLDSARDPIESLYNPAQRQHLGKRCAATDAR